jgi:hypothetical protein
VSDAPESPEPVVPVRDPAAEPMPAAVDPNPEKRMGAAFAGGLAAAIVLKRLVKRRHVR